MSDDLNGTGQRLGEQTSGRPNAGQSIPDEAAAAQQAFDREISSQIIDAEALSPTLQTAANTLALPDGVDPEDAERLGPPTTAREDLTSASDAPNAAQVGRLEAGSSLVSANGRYSAVFGQDGALSVIDNRTGESQWETPTAGLAEGGTLAVQTNGKLVIRDAEGAAVWQSNAALATDDYTLRLQNDGDLLLRNETTGVSERLTDRPPANVFEHLQTAEPASPFTTFIGPVHQPGPSRPTPAQAEFAANVDPEDAERVAAPAPTDPFAGYSTVGFAAPQPGLEAYQGFVIRPADADATATTALDDQPGFFGVSQAEAWEILQAQRAAAAAAPPVVPTTSLGTGVHGRGPLLSENHEFRLTLGADGNLELTDLVANTVVWESGLGLGGADAGAQLSIGTDGNLALLRADGSVYWGSGTSRGAQAEPLDYTLTVSDQGQVQLTEDGTGAQIWTSPIYRRPSTASTEGPVSSIGNGTRDALRPLLSENGEFSLTLGGDGNLQLTDLETLSVIWESGLSGAQYANAQISVRDDGNLALIDAEGTIYWGSGTSRGSQAEAGEYTLTITDDGQVRLTDANTAAEIWSTPAYTRPAAETGPSFSGDRADTFGNGRYEAGASITSTNGLATAVFQADGNLVVRRGDEVVWETGTAGAAAGGTFTIQADGNFVVYNANGDPAWATNTYDRDDVDSVRRDFALTLSDNGTLTLRDTERGNQVLWTSRDGVIANPEGGAPPAEPISISDGNVDPTLLAPVVLNGQVIEPIPGAVPEDFPLGLNLLNVLSGSDTGFSAEQYDRIASDTAALSALEQIAAVGTGRLEINDPAEIELRELFNQTEDEIIAALYRGFDLAQGPDADQLIGLNLLAQGNDAAFIELLFNWTLQQHPDLDFLFNPTRFDPRVDRSGAEFTHSTSIQGETSFLSWLQDLVPVRGLSPQREIVTSVEGRNDPDRRVEGVLELRGGPAGEEENIRLSEYVDRDYSLAPTLSHFREISSEADYLRVVDRLFRAGPSGPESYTTTGDNGRVVRFTLNTNLRGEFNERLGTYSRGDIFQGFGSSLLRDVLEVRQPDIISGNASSFLITTQNQTIDNATDVGNLFVIDVGSVDTTINVDAGDGQITSVGTVGSDINLGTGNSFVSGRDTQDLDIVDSSGRHDTVTVVNLEGDNADTFITTDQQSTVVEFGEGTAEDAFVDGNGDITVAVAPGGTLSDSEVTFQDTNGTFTAAPGSTVTGSTLDGGRGDDVFTLDPGSIVSDSEILGGAGDDRFFFSGEIIGGIVETGDGNDYIQINETFRGQFDLSDSAAAWIWAGDNDLNEYDTVALQGEGWDLVETPEGQALIARDAETNEILAQINLSGDAEHLESIYTFDENGRIATLQDIPPEVRSRLGFLGPLTQTLFALAPLTGPLAPAVGAVGGVLQFLQQAVNEQLSFESVVGIIGNAAGAAGAGRVATVANTVSEGLQGDVRGVVEGFIAAGASFEAHGDGGPGFFTELQNSGNPLAGIGGGTVLNLAEGDDPLQALFDGVVESEIVPGLEATIFTVDTIGDGNVFGALGGFAMIGAAVTEDGTQRLFLAAEDAADVGQALSEGQFTRALGAATGFLVENGFVEPLQVFAPFPAPQAGQLTQTDLLLGDAGEDFTFDIEIPVDENGNPTGDLPPVTVPTVGVAPGGNDLTDEDGPEIDGIPGFDVEIPLDANGQPLGDLPDVTFIGDTQPAGLRLSFNANGGSNNGSSIFNLVDTTPAEPVLIAGGLQFLPPPGGPGDGQPQRPLQHQVHRRPPAQQFEDPAERSEEVTVEVVNGTTGQPVSRVTFDATQDELDLIESGLPAGTDLLKGILATLGGGAAALALAHLNNPNAPIQELEAIAGLGQSADTLIGEVQFDVQPPAAPTPEAGAGGEVAPALEPGALEDASGLAGASGALLQILADPPPPAERPPSPGFEQTITSTTMQTTTGPQAGPDPDVDLGDAQSLINLVAPRAITTTGIETRVVNGVPVNTEITRVRTPAQNPLLRFLEGIPGLNDIVKSATGGDATGVFGLLRDTLFPEGAFDFLPNPQLPTPSQTFTIDGAQFGSLYRFDEETQRFSVNATQIPGTNALRFDGTEPVTLRISESGRGTVDPALLLNLPGVRDAVGTGAGGQAGTLDLPSIGIGAARGFSVTINPGQNIPAPIIQALEQGQDNFDLRRPLDGSGSAEIRFSVRNSDAGLGLGPFGQSTFSALTTPEQIGNAGSLTLSFDAAPDANTLIGQEGTFRQSTTLRLADLQRIAGQTEPDEATGLTPRVAQIYLDAVTPLISAPVNPGILQTGNIFSPSPDATREVFRDAEGRALPRLQLSGDPADPTTIINVDGLQVHNLNQSPDGLLVFSGLSRDPASGEVGVDPQGSASVRVPAQIIEAIAGGTLTPDDFVALDQWVDQLAEDGAILDFEEGRLNTFLDTLEDESVARGNPAGLVLNEADIFALSTVLFVFGQGVGGDFSFVNRP